MDTTTTQKLRFRIVECTGEDPQHPVSELLTSSPQSNGWQSQRFCSFPQYITFQFLTPVLLKQIQFLSHENKIATKLELFTAVTDSKHPLPSSDLKYRKLGFLTLDSNEASNYQLRELKTVYVEAPSFYLRVAFHKCHINKYNFFNQVGLVALAAYGEPVVVAPPKPLPQPEKKERAEPITPLDEMTAKRIKEYEGAKQKAVEAEAFEEAQLIKADISKLKSLGLQIRRLEDKKVVALQETDYSGADKFKKEIEKLKEAVMQIGAGGKSRSNTRLLQPDKGYSTQDSYEESQKDSYLEIPDRPSVKNRMSAKEGRVRNSSQGRSDDGEEMKIDREYNPDSDTKEVGYRMTHDEKVVPALSKKNPAEYIDEKSPQNLVQEAEELSAPNQKLAEPIAPVVGAEMCKKIFSKHWNLREEALNTLIAELPKQSKSQVINYTDDAAVFVSMTAIVSYTIVDRLPQISARAMTLLKTIISKKSPNVTAKSDLATYIDAITNSLVEKLGDNNTRVRDQAEEVFISMAKNPLVTCNYCVNAVVKGGPTGKHKGGSTPKHIISRLKVLQAIVKEFKINNHDVPYNIVLEYLTEKFEHPNAEVRAMVVSLLVEIHHLVGEKLMTDLEGMKLAHIEILKKEFDAAAAGKGNASPGKGSDAKVLKGSPTKGGDAKPAHGKGNENEKGLNGKTDGKAAHVDKNKAHNSNKVEDGRGSAVGK